MKDRDIHKIIEQQDGEMKRRIWENVRSQIDVTPAPQSKPAAKKNVWKWITATVVAICIVAVSIVLPVVLQDEGARFCDSSNYAVEELDVTLKEYFSANNRNLLYVDWYDVADQGEIITSYAHIIGNDKDIVFYEEVIFNNETGEELTLSITDNKTRVDKLEQYQAGCETYTVSNVNVSWKTLNQRTSYATFEYDKHVYYLQIDIGDGQARLTEIIEEMLK